VEETTSDLSGRTTIVVSASRGLDRGTATALAYAVVPRVAKVRRRSGYAIVTLSLPCVCVAANAWSAGAFDRRQSVAPAAEALSTGRRPERFQRFFLTVIVTGLLVAVAPTLSVARAVSVYVPAPPTVHRPV
jgi:hypothetical protein